MKKFKGYFLVFSQFLLILIILLPLGTPVTNLFIGLLFIILGISIGLLALYTNRVDNFNIRPEIKQDACLVTTGVYAYIRHPMYTSVLTIMLGFVLLYPLKFVIVSYILLIIILLIKLFYEESLWKCEGSQHKEYMKNTKRLVPFIF